MLEKYDVELLLKFFLQESHFWRGVLAAESILGPPGEGYGKPLQYSSLENPHGQRSLVGYSSWSHKESDTTV